MEIILRQAVENLGKPGDVVKVKAGYARNYLFPQGLAIPLTGANKRRIEVLKQRRGEREAHELTSMTELAKSISKLICVITVKTGEDGKMFGAVTNGMIADQLKTQFDVSLDKRKIHLDHPIRALGEHEVQLRLHQDVTTTLKVRVESSTPLPVPAVAPVSEARREEPRTEKRGRRPEAVAAQVEGGERKPRFPKAERPARSDKPARREKPAGEQKSDSAT